MFFRHAVILRSAPICPAAKQPQGMMLPPPCLTVGRVFSLCPPNVTMVIMATQLKLVFVRPQDISNKSLFLWAFGIWLFYVSFIIGSFPLVSLLIKTPSYSFSQLLHKVFCLSLVFVAFVLGLMCTVWTMECGLGDRPVLGPVCLKSSLEIVKISYWVFFYSHCNLWHLGFDKPASLLLRSKFLYRSLQNLIKLCSLLSSACIKQQQLLKAIHSLLVR